MLRRLAFPLFVLLLVAAAISSKLNRADPAAATSAGAPAPKAVTAASSTSLTAKAVTAAKAFKASLSASQQAALQFSFDAPTKKTGWSNLPVGLVPRKGVEVGNLTADQSAKLVTLLKTTLSAKGYSDEQATRAADTYLNTSQQNGSGGAQQLQYGAGLYYVAFYGTPSTSSKWTIQFGGHHYAIHLTFSGATVSNTPYFVGVEPRTTFKVNGKSYAPMVDESAALFGAVRALSSSELAKAKLAQSFDDVVVGPQEDGQFPTKQGVTVGSLSAAKRALVTKAIRTYVGDIPTAQATARVAAYVKQYGQTKLAYSGATDGTTRGGYVRIHGPRVWIEIAVQNGIVLSGTHYHSIERDVKTDYGAGT